MASQSEYNEQIAKTDTFRGLSDYELAYIGPKLDTGRMDLRLLSESLAGFASLTERSSAILFGQTYEHTAEIVSAPEKGSVVVPIEIVPHALKAVQGAIKSSEQVLLTPGVQALSNLCTLLGVGAASISVGLFKMFKTKKGRALDPTLDALLLKNMELNLELQKYIRLYNDAEIRWSTRRTLRPLREDGIAEFQTRYRGVIIERVTKSDLLEADAAELQDKVEYEERWLDIQKVALVKHLAWHFSGDGQTFDAKIDDDTFWRKVDEGERYGSRDRLRVVLRTRATHDKNGKLHVDYLVTEVLQIEHHRLGVQQDFFPNDPRK